MNMNEIMRQAREFQQKMSQMQSELAERTVTASAGGGMVSITVNGRCQLQSIHIDREVIKPEEQEMLHDLIMAAVNEGMQKAQNMAQEQMRKLTGGISIPGMF